MLATGGEFDGHIDVAAGITQRNQRLFVSFISQNFDCCSEWDIFDLEQQQLTCRLWGTELEREAVIAIGEALEFNNSLTSLDLSVINMVGLYVCN